MDMAGDLRTTREIEARAAAKKAKARGAKRTALFVIDGYAAVIPHIQNVYPPEKGRTCWKIGFKYIDSGVFEFFDFTHRKDAEREHARLLDAIDAYWMTRKSG